MVYLYTIGMYQSNMYQIELTRKSETLVDYGGAETTENVPMSAVI